MDSLIDRTTPKAMKQALKRLPKGSEALDKAYDKALERVEAQKEGFRELATQVLSWITYAARPLTTLELQQALAVEVGTSEL
jgi:cell division septal protein FtsQ